MVFTWKNCFRICISVFLVYLCMEYFEVFLSLLTTVLGAATPLFVGAGAAYVVNILMSFYERHYFPNTTNRSVIKSRRVVCMTGAYLSLIAIIIFVVNLVLPQLVSCVKLILKELPTAMEFAIKAFDEWNIVSEEVSKALIDIDWKSRVTDVMGMLTSGMSNVAKMIASVFSGIVTGFLGIIFSIYLLLSKDKLKCQFRMVMNKFVRESIICKVEYVYRTFNESFHRYIVGQCTEAVILGALCSLGMLLLRMPYATMIGAFIAFTALIPVAGAYIGAGVGAFMILTVSPVKALIFLVFIVVLQQLEGNLIYPRVVGSSIGLPAIWVLAAVTVGGGMMGVAGMLLGVPVAAAIYKMIGNVVKTK